MIIWLYGADSYRSRKKLHEFKEKFRCEIDPAGHSLVELSGPDLDFSSFQEAVSAPSLFVRKRLIVIERLLSAKKKELNRQLADYLREQGDGGDNILIFWDEVDSEDKEAKWKSDPLFKFLEKQKIRQEFKSLSATAARDWLRERAARSGVQLRVDAAQALAAKAGTDLWALDNELKKLISYKQGQKLLTEGEPVIEIRDVEELAKGAAEENIFALTDALGRQDKAAALACLEKEREAGAADPYLLHMVLRQFRILLRVKQALENGLSSRKIQSDLKLHPFVAQKALSQARFYSLSDLKGIFVKLARIDGRLKSGRSDLKTDLAILIAAM